MRRTNEKESEGGGNQESPRNLKEKQEDVFLSTQGRKRF